MLELKGNNLGKRQQELNAKVHEAFESKLNFDEIKDTKEISDVDRLFKIDLAIAYKNIDYIVETLKCGDNLYISRALKCPWLYENEFNHVINPDNLHQNIFPLMSTKMKRKTLAAIALHTKDAMRAFDFYTYCTSTQINNIACDFLLKTSDAVKKEYLTGQICLNNSLKFEQFFGSSFDIIEFYLEKRKTTRQDLTSDIFSFRYLYSCSAEKYLNLLEAYTEEPTYTYYNRNKRFGLRISKDIMVSHKSRVLDKPWLYLNKLNMKMIIKYSSSDDAKIYLVALLPNTANEFWSMDYYSTYKDVIRILPATEIYKFLKQLFATKYPDELFEMHISFYRLKYYDLLTSEERNEWALKHLEEKKEILGPGRDFVWYYFVKFDLAFPAIKQLIFKTTCPDKRSETLRVLIYAARNQEDLEKLLTHYYERHVNEDRRYKEKFIVEIIEYHNVFEFNEKCWKLLNKLLHSLNAFETGQFTDMYTILAIVYNIIHNNDMPEILMPHCEIRFDKIRSSLFSMHNKNLKPDQYQLVYQWFMTKFENKIKELMEQSRNDDEAKKCLVTNIENVLSFMDQYKKTKDDCPVIVMDCIKLHWETFNSYKWFKTEIMSEGLLLRLLKKDYTLLIDKLPAIKEYTNKTYAIFRINQVLQKIRIYFPNEVAKSFQTFFEEWLNKSEILWERDLNQIFFCLFYLADEDYKINLMSRHAPTEAKIQHDVIDKKLRIQKKICSFAFYSRPPVPLSKMLEYIKGDYVHFCIPMFSSYLVTLPMPQSLKFLEALLNAPVSIQKHGLRLAFVSYDPENLKQLILDVWKKTKNVSLRAIIYKALFDKIKKDNISAQSKLYPVLKMLTSDLHENDHDDIFNLLVSSGLPFRYNGDYLETAWTTVRKLPQQNSVNNDRKANVMRSIASQIEQIEREFCRTQIIDEHIQTQFIDKQILHVDNNYGISNLIDEKWNVTAKYITHFGDDELNSSIEILQLIMNKCLEMWDEVYGNKYMVRAFLIQFILRLKYQTDYRKDRERKPYMVPVYERILDFLKKSWPLEEMYTVVWEVKLTVMALTSIGNGKYNSDKKAITYDHLSSTEVAHEFANEIVEFLKDLLSKQHFCSSFYTIIEKAVIETTQLMTNWTNLDHSTLINQVSYALTKFDLFEAKMLALTILPVGSNDWVINYSDIILAIREYNNFELNAFMYQKFLYNDFIKRH